MLSLCPNCQLQLDFSQVQPGATVACPRCGSPFNKPGITPPPLPSPQYPTQTFEDNRSVKKTRLSRRRKYAGSILDVLFDWNFRLYITPLIVKATWFWAVISATLALMFVILLFVSEPLAIVANSLPAQAPTRSMPNVEFHTPEALAPSTGTLFIFVRIAFYSWLIGSIAFWLLWIRVALEGIIVIFDIADMVHTGEMTLEEIRDSASYRE